MNNGNLTSRIRYASSDILKVNSSTGRTQTPAGWILASSPTLLCLVALFIAWYLQALLSTVLLAILTVVMICFFIAIVYVHLQTESELTLTPNGITVQRKTFAGTRVRHIYHEDIAGLRAAVQGQDLVRLSADTRSGGQITLLTVKVEDFDEQARRIANILTKPYTLTINCPLPTRIPSFEIDNSPDFVRVDSLRRTLILELLDSRRTEVPFDQVDSVGVIGPVKDEHYDFSTTIQMFEYIYQPAIYFKDGTFQLLQRFRSLEDQKTNKSQAFESATRFANYLQNCISIASHFDPNEDQELAATRSKFLDSTPAYS